MKLFVDSAHLPDIEEALRRGFPAGLTIDLPLISRSHKANFKQHLRRIINLLDHYKLVVPLSVNVLALEPNESVGGVLEFVSEYSDYEGLTVEVPIGWDELALIKQLKNRGLQINCTGCVSLDQALMAALAGADFVSLFHGLNCNVELETRSVIQDVHRAFKQGALRSQLLVGGIKRIADVTDAFLAGADVVTVQPQVLRQMPLQPQSVKPVGRFVADPASLTNHANE